MPMQLSGEQVVDASIDHVWEILHRADILQRITPGVETLEPIDDPDRMRYRATYQVRIGPLTGRFTGTIELVDIQPPQILQLVMQLSSNIGGVKAEATIHLHSIGEAQTKVIYKGTAQISGMLMTVGQRFVMPTAKKMIGEFFEQLAKEVQSTR